MQYNYRQYLQEFDAIYYALYANENEELFSKRSLRCKTLPKEYLDLDTVKAKILIEFNYNPGGECDHFTTSVCC